MTISGEAERRKAQRRPKARVRRDRTIRLSLTSAEFEAVTAAAAEAGLANGAYAARTVLAAARGPAAVGDEPLREVLGELVRASGLVRRIGVNLNQAVARLNSTGVPSGDLAAYARESLRRADRLDQAAEAVLRRLR